MTTTLLPSPSLRRAATTPHDGSDDSALTSGDVPARNLCGSCAGCPRAALRAGPAEKV